LEDVLKDMLEDALMKELKYNCICILKEVILRKQGVTYVKVRKGM